MRGLLLRALIGVMMFKVRALRLGECTLTGDGGFLNDTEEVLSGKGNFGHKRKPRRVVFVSPVQ